jgi:hypothetical protein
MEPGARFTCLISIEGVRPVLDELIRTALNEAAMAYVVPDTVDHCIWHSVIQQSEPARGTPDD